MKQYDYLIVGCGLFGSVVAEQMTKKGKSCLVIDKRGHIGGNVYTNTVLFINMEHTFSTQMIREYGSI